MRNVLERSKTSFCCSTEYCERYAKNNSKSGGQEEESGEEDISDGQYTSSDDDEIPGHADL